MTVSNAAGYLGDVWSNIQAAVTAASSGDAVTALAGTYNEDVTISTTISLLVQAGDDPNTALPATGSQSIIDSADGLQSIAIEADNVTIDGFTIEGVIVGPSAKPGSLGAGIWESPGEYASDHGGAQILDNIIQDNIAGIALGNDGTYPALVQYNLIQNNNDPGHGSGIGIELSGTLDDAEIDSNTFAGQPSASVSLNGVGNNVKISNNQMGGTGIGVFGVGDVSVTANTLTGGAGVGVFDADEISILANTITGADYAGVELAGVTNATVSENTIVGTQADPTDGAAISIDHDDGPNGGNITITHNFLGSTGDLSGLAVSNPNVYGILITGSALTDDAVVAINTNFIYDNTTAGLENDSGVTVNASGNWWGSANGPTTPLNLYANGFSPPLSTGDAVNGPDVTIGPWLSSGAYNPTQFPGFYPVTPLNTTPPTTTITDGLTGVANIATGNITLTVTFSQPVAGFAASDIVLANGTAGAFTPEAGGEVYTLVVTPQANFQGNLTADVAAGVAETSDGNPNTAATELVQAVDTLAPTTTITDGLTGVANIATGNITLTVTFSQPVTGFTAGDIVLAHGTAGAFTPEAGGEVYTLVVTPQANFQGNLTADVAAGVAETSDGNPNTAATELVQAVDTLAPTTTITDGLTGVANIATGNITLTVTFSQPVTGFTAGDIVLAHGTAGAFTPEAGGEVYTLVVTPQANFQGNLTADVAAGVAETSDGNPNTAATELVQAVDTLAPTTTITDGLTGVANIATGNITLTVTFSQPVTGFTAGDIVLAHGTAGAFTPEAGGEVYTLVVTPQANFQGNLTADVAAGVAETSDGNPNTAATELVQAVDTLAPTTTITDGLTGVANIATGNITLTVTFSQPVTGFTAGDMVLAHGTAGAFTPEAGGEVYTLVVTPQANFQGNLTADVAAGVAETSDGNPNTAATELVQAVDTLAPTTTITDGLTGVANIATGNITLTVTFSQPVTGFTAGDIVLAHGTAGAFTPEAGGEVYTLVVTPQANFQGNLTADVAAGVAETSDGNPNTAATELVQAVDTLAPTTTITDGLTGVANIATGNITLTVTFSQPVTGFTAGDMVPRARDGGGLHAGGWRRGLHVGGDAAGQLPGQPHGGRGGGRGRDFGRQSEHGGHGVGAGGGHAGADDDDHGRPDGRGEHRHGQHHVDGHLQPAGDGLYGGGHRAGARDGGGLHAGGWRRGLHVGGDAAGQLPGQPHGGRGGGRGRDFGRQSEHGGHGVGAGGGHPHADGHDYGQPDAQLRRDLDADLHLQRGADGLHGG